MVYFTADTFLHDLLDGREPFSYKFETHTVSTPTIEQRMEYHAPKLHQCENCGANLKSYECDYCGSAFY